MSGAQRHSPASDLLVSARARAVASQLINEENRALITGLSQQGVYRMKAAQPGNFPKHGLMDNAWSASPAPPLALEIALTLQHGGFLSPHPAPKCTAQI